MLGMFESTSTTGGTMTSLLTTCRCGQYLETAPNGLVYCSHCDRHCTVDRKKYICPRCDQLDAVWKELVKKFYGKKGN
jgi:hypothetical protein